VKPPVNAARSEAKPPIVMLAGVTVEPIPGLAKVMVSVNGEVKVGGEWVESPE